MPGVQLERVEEKGDGWREEEERVVVAVWRHLIAPTYICVPPLRTSPRTSLSARCFSFSCSLTSMYTHAPTYIFTSSLSFYLPYMLVHFSFCTKKGAVICDICPAAKKEQKKRVTDAYVLQLAVTLPPPLYILCQTPLLSSFLVS